MFFSFLSVAKRRLAFLNKEGYDRFGKNNLFAPLMKWDALKTGIETIKDRAKSYEDAYNKIKTSIEDEISSLKKALPQAALTQVIKEMERLVESRRVAVSQKGVYVRVGVKIEQRKYRVSKHFFFLFNLLLRELRVGLVTNTGSKYHEICFKYLENYLRFKQKK